MLLYFFSQASAQNFPVNQLQSLVVNICDEISSLCLKIIHFLVAGIIFLLFITIIFIYMIQYHEKYKRMNEYYLSYEMYLINPSNRMLYFISDILINLVE